MPIIVDPPDVPVPPLAVAPAGVDAEAWDAACAAVRAYCGWHIAPSVTQTLTLDGSDTDVMLLPTLHVTDLSSITNDGTAVTEPEWSTFGIVRGTCWTDKFRGVVVSFTHGYDECPPEIIGVLHEAADRGLEGSAASQVGQVRMGGVDGVAGAVAFVMDKRSDVLDRYKLPPRP